MKASNRLLLIFGIGIFALGLVITVFTWIFLNSGTIWFGILQFIGVSVVLGYLLLKHGIRGLMQ